VPAGSSRVGAGRSTDRIQRGRPALSSRRAVDRVWRKVWEGKIQSYSGIKRLRTLTPPPPHAPCAPLALTTCTPSVPLVTAGFTSPSGACSACASPIFVESASPPGMACAALEALFGSARAPRGSTRDPRGAGGPSGPWGSTRTCSACASRPGGRRPDTLFFYPRVIPPQNMPTARPGARERSGLWRRRAVRAPVGDAAAPVAMGNALHGRWASRRSAVGLNRLVPQGHGWCRSSRRLCSSCNHRSGSVRAASTRCGA